MKTKNIISRILAAAFIAAVFASCGNKAPAAVSPESGLPADFKITIMVNDWTGSPNSGEYGARCLELLKQYTGYDIDVWWVTSDNYNDKLATLLVSGKEAMPKILSAGARPIVINAAANGAFWPVEDYLTDSQAYPNLSRQSSKIRQAFSANGHQFGPLMQANTVGRYGFGYRADWAEKLGISEPYTIDDVYNLLYAFTYNDPDGNGKKDTYGLNLCSYTGPLDVMQTWFGVGNKWADDGNGNIIPVHKTPEYMEALRWFKKLYDNGLIASDWAIRDTASWKQDNYNSIAGVYIDCTDDVKNIWDYYEQNGVKSVVDPAKTATMVMLPGIAKDKNSPRVTLASPPTGGFAITRAAENEAEVKACLDFLDKMCNDEALMVVLRGLENIHWKYNEAGEVDRINPGDTLLHKSYNGLNQLTPYIPNRFPVKYKFARDVQTQLQEDTFAASEKIGVFNPAIGYYTNAATYITNGSSLDLIIEDARIQYIVGDINESGLKSAWDLWERTGGADLIKEVNALIKADKS
ncbi:lipoprotein LipO [Spirochaetia bacterium]|nr:lipoprotein LipO [Spirochaetia bacterium]